MKARTRPSIRIAILSGMLFGVLPAFRVGRWDVHGALKRSAPGAGTSRAWARVRNGLVVVQVALALVLLIGAGLMVRSIRSLHDVNPGFQRPDDVLTFRLFIPEAELPSLARVAALEREILDRVREVPGVVSAGAAWSLPMTGAMMSAPIRVEGDPADPDRAPVPRRQAFVTPGYLETIRVAIVAGRSLAWADLDAGAKAVLVSENLARERWGGPSAALGRRIQLTGPRNDWSVVVGVVADVRDDGVAQDAPAIVYWPLTSDFLRGGAARSFAIAVRSDRPLSTLLPAVQRAVSGVDSSLPLADVRSLRAILDASMARSAFAMVMLSLAGAIGLIVGLVGVYGVISYVVSQRTREIGLRIALGARPENVRGMVVREAAGVTGLGVVIGLGAAVGLTRLMTGLLHGVEPVDPVTYGIVALLVVIISLAASIVPARRAAAVAPIIALRAD